ncbi:translocation/assembly module TamB domain-containing protein [Daejeonella oryzae]|uniref:translocation/assembly module TamB domain-containing protein n=1 Tax=Daejeonella oryzae TaxID=1122943 RepID=UPI00040DBBC2|nr:translocation/assembly module TamB domain-containing protein [Daejeonella oryzae]
MLATILLLLAALVFSLQFKPVQTYVAKKAAQYLSKELNTRVEVKSLYIKPFKSVVLEGLYVEDLEKDTLIFSPKFTLDVSEFSLKNRKIAVATAQMDDGKFYIKQYKDTTTNLEFIINYFDTGTTKPRKKPRKSYDITFDKIVLNGIDFKYKNFNVDTVIKGINFNDLHLRNLNTTVTGLDTKNHLVKAHFKNLTFKEKSGFYLKNLTTNATIDSNQMQFSDLLLETPESRISDFLLFKYSKFKDFSQFISKVHMTAQFKNSKIYSKDVAYFVPQMNKMDLDLRVDGSIKGYVDNLKAKQLAVKVGRTTYMKGDFDVKGLPDINKTLLNLNFDQVYTNKKDIDYIVSKATGKNKVITPVILQKFGNINFKGRFSGFTNDFIAYGEFKTALGRVVSDINMKIPAKGQPVYSGVVKTYDFDLGNLLDQKKLGRTTLVANIKGSGFNLKTVKEQIKGDITYFDFNGYRYTNILLDGTYANNLFDGQIKVNDRNVKLDFQGGVNLNPKVPVFDFKANIRGANLYALNFTKDTVQVDADFNTNFTGNNLDNIQGSFDIRKIRLTNTEHSFVVDSLQLSAIGIGKSRELKINSDILDASIKGEYDLNTLPSYFKSVAKTYIPSLQVRYVKPKPQNFEFNLTLKYFEPISLLFIPELKIPEQASITGQFNSEQNIANLSGFSKLVTYNKLKFNNLIIDQTTTPLALNLFITSDQVDITDSLYIKNVNIANILSNDSLKLNIKLSDKDAINQLDLNGLVEFSKVADSTAKLSLLPSDVIINRETWRIQYKVSFNFEDGKTIIRDFELFRDNQLLTVNGIISTDPDDELIIGFNKFKLTTFNPLTRSLGINLSGELNGNAKLAAISKTPRIEAALIIDTLKYNDILIGDLNLDADFDNSTKLVNVKMDIMNDDIKALDLQGTYNANSDQNNLDMDVKMRDNQVIIFQPFLKKLVSNLTGKVSADLKITGKLKTPKINGSLKLNNAGMTVNYLKTPYHLSDEVSVNNSVISLNNLIIKDINEHEAIANGTVDMNNINNPEIHITIVANNFMALNTTSKDNPLYYGIAYGSGVFKFNGPTDNMKIDIDASTQAGTVFNIPLNSSATVRENDFINFVAKDSTLTVKKETSFMGLTMNFDLRVDENSEVNIFTDLGKLSGRGDAELALRITSLGDFEMYGDYVISKGKFEFIAQDFINKIFEINKGGSIRWTGNPTEAAINLDAAYSARPSLQPLYTAAGRTDGIDQRVLAEAVMKLKGSLLQPDIVFDINFPADAYIKDELQSYFSDVNNVNQQALSLIIRRSFAPGTGADLFSLTPTFINAGTELFFNQLNNVITQTLNLNFVDFNIRSFNDASASLRLLNGRLLLTGGVTDPRSLQDFDVLGGSSVARDVEAQYLLNKDGSLVLKASQRLNNRNFLNSNIEYVNALGLLYRQDFDNVNEFLRTLIGKKRSEERRKKELEENKKPIAVKLPEENEKKK